MSKDFVFNMGYDTSHVTSVLAKEGLEDGSRVVLITPSSIDGRQENSIKDIENYLDSLDFNVSLETYSLSGSITPDTAGIKRLFSRLDEVILSLSGGPRDFLIPMTLATGLTDDNLVVYFRSDLDSELEQVVIPQIPLELTDSEQEVLNTIDETSIKASKIIDKTDLSGSSVYRILSDLEEKSLVNSSEESGSRKYSISKLGEII